MHGVGHRWVKEAFQHFQHASLNSVPSQTAPDPEFPTVKFPNPEEKGALDESIAYAATENAELILANDPDADRLAVAERTSTTSSSNKSDWYVFSGNELGVLLGYWQIQRWKRNNGDKKAACLASIVSSRMLKAIAEKEGLLYQDTLTGKHYCIDGVLLLLLLYIYIYIFIYIYKYIKIYYFSIHMHVFLIIF